MSDTDIIEWLQMLGPTNVQREAVITDLLRHKAMDRMSQEDVAACLRGLELLAEGRVPEAAPPMQVMLEEELVEI